MRATARVVALSLLFGAAPSLAFAQRFDFERTFDVDGPIRLEVSTLRGTIEVVAGEPGRIVVDGVAAVRIGWDVPLNAVELARQVAGAPPIERAGAVLRLRVPADRAAQRAVNVSYRVRVPPDTDVRSTSESGATSISGVSAPVDVHTQSGAIDVVDLSGAVRVSTGSGAVAARNISGALAVRTSSSAFRGTRLGSSLHVRTQSGRVDAALEGHGDVDVETGSSAVSLDLERSGGFLLDAASRSGSITVEGSSVSGSVTKRAARGTVGNGGPTVLLRTGSGAIRVQSPL